MGRRDGLTSVDEFVTQLAARSTVIADQIKAGTLAIVGATYHLADGRVQAREHLGDIGDDGAE